MLKFVIIKAVKNVLDYRKFLTAYLIYFLMNSQNNLEINGKLHEHPLAELITEISQLRLNGSLRVSNAAQKIVIYFDAGDVVFAVSNSRVFRFYEFLLRAGSLSKNQLVEIPNFTNDFVLSTNLLEKNLVAKPSVDKFFTRQIEEILLTALQWHEGVWVFSPLVRARADFRYKIDVQNLLIEYARKLPDEEKATRINDLNAFFSTKSPKPAHINLLPNEAFIYSRCENVFLNIEKISARCGLPESSIVPVIYALWLGGFLYCRSWNAAFSEKQTSEMLSAKLTLVKEPNQTVSAVSKAAIPTNGDEQVVQENNTENAPMVEETFSVEKHLQRIENANNFYEVLDVDQKCDTPEIKQAYFALAKRLHPDLFYKEADAQLHRRIQNAFTKLAHVYETLKTSNSRELYDFKMRKMLGENQNSSDTQDSSKNENPGTQASENFDRGFSLLLEEDLEAALPFLFRAVHFAPNNARYHAYYGKALSYVDKQHHKAEAELQTAVKLDAENADFRIMLAEFYIKVGLLKRAEGELNRLLAKFPQNREAQTLLDSLRNK